jgi:hypothetical protein
MHAGEHVVTRQYGDEVQALCERISDRMRTRLESLTVLG